MNDAMNEYLILYYSYEDACTRVLCYARVHTAGKRVHTVAPTTHCSACLPACDLSACVRTRARWQPDRMQRTQAPRPQGCARADRERWGAGPLSASWERAASSSDRGTDVRRAAEGDKRAGGAVELGELGAGVLEAVIVPASSALLQRSGST